MRRNPHRLVIAVTWLFMPAVALASLAACSDDSAPSGSPTPSLTGTSAERPVAMPTPNTPSSVTPILTYGPDTRTGVAAVDTILVSVLAADARAVESRLAYVAVPCTARSSTPGPECPPGEPAGTLVAAFPLTACESTYERKDTIGPVVAGFVTPGLRLFAVYQVDGTRAGNEAPGAYGLVFVDPRPIPNATGTIMIVVTADTEGRIVRWGSSCGATDPHEFMATRPVAGYVLPPP